MYCELCGKEIANPITTGRYLGHSMDYWLEAENIIKIKGAVDFVEEIACLRSKVCFYEKHIDDLYKLMADTGVMHD